MRKKITEEKVKLAQDRYIEVSNQVRCLCINYLQQVLKEIGEIVIDNINIPEFISVSYDGGNHPEYASNVYSTVNRIYLDTDDDILLDTEDTSGYSISNISTEEVCALCDFIIKYKKELCLYD